MTRGFLLLDQKMNTVIIPADDPELSEFFRYRRSHENILDGVRVHDTLKSLDADVRKYLKGEYNG